MPRDELILSFDTSAAHCAAALLYGDTVLADHLVETRKGQVEMLFPILESILADAKMSWQDVSRIGVGIGPGNFTGTRISVSAARGLALSLGIPAIGVSTFQSMVLGQDFPAMVFVPAWQGQMYFQEYGINGQGAPGVVAISAIPDALNLKGKTIIGLSAENGEMPGARICKPLHSLAVGICKTAAAADPQRSERPAPLYIRAPDAAPQKMAGPRILP